MITDELKKEAEESFEKYRVTDIDYVVSPYSEDEGEKKLMFNNEYDAEEEYYRLYSKGYLASAEPREKRIAELEKEVEKHKWNDIFLEDCAVYDKKIAEEYTTLQESIATLEKVNAELKERYANINLNANIAVRDLNDQLTKAKEILKAVVGFYPTTTATILCEAEKFISEVEK